MDVDQHLRLVARHARRRSMNLEARSVLLFLCAAILDAACASTSSSTAGNAGSRPGSGGPAGTTAQAAPAIGAAASSVSGVDLAGMDHSVKPGDDFFRFTNGGWYDRTEIPPDRSVFGTFSVLGEPSAKRTADLIAEASKGNAPEGSEARKIGDTYAS